MERKRTALHPARQTDVSGKIPSPGITDHEFGMFSCDLRITNGGVHHCLEDLTIGSRGTSIVNGLATNAKVGC